MDHAQCRQKGLLAQGTLTGFIAAFAAAVQLFGCAACGSNGARPVDALPGSGGGESGVLAGGHSGTGGARQRAATPAVTGTAQLST